MSAGDRLWDLVVEYISDEGMDLDDVFDVDEIKRQVQRDYELDDLYDEDDILDWIQRKNYDPEEVFDEEVLQRWGRESEPEDIFDPETLREWARANGFVEEE